MNTQARILVLLIGCLLIEVWSCTYPDFPARGNMPPHTRIVNPPLSDTTDLYSGTLLYWIGSDEDGYIIAYTYRWSDFSNGHEYPQPSRTILNIENLGPVALPRTIIVRGARSLPDMYKFFFAFSNEDQNLAWMIADSLLTGRPFAVPYRSGAVAGDSVVGGDSLANAAPTHGFFIFESPTTTMHTFSVAAIDNNGAVDPAPARASFWTPAAFPPHVTISTPDIIGHISTALIDSNQFAIRHQTDRFRGLQFDFSGVDRFSSQLLYSWAVDSMRTGDWSPWTDSRQAFVVASDFKPVVSGWHMFYVRAKNPLGGISNIDSARFKAIIPAIDDPGNIPRILVINQTLAGNGFLGHPDTNQIKAFYSTVLDSLGFAGRYDVWTVAGRSSYTSYPPLISFGNYSTVILSMDRALPAVGSSLYMLNTDRQTILKRYLAIGGNLICSGPVGANAIVAASQWYQGGYNFDPFPLGIVHATILAQNDSRQFVGFKGKAELGYPYVRVDSTKLPPDSLGSIRSIIVVTPLGLGEPIGSYDSDSLRPQGRHNPAFENQQVGMRYLAPDPVPPAHRTCSVVHFGFPLYFGEKSAVIAAMRQALIDVRTVPN